MHNFVTWLATAVGFAAAMVWLYASCVRVPPIGSGWGRLVGVEEAGKAMQKQGRLNSVAAVMTATYVLIELVAGYL